MNRLFLFRFIAMILASTLVVPPQFSLALAANGSRTGSGQFGKVEEFLAFYKETLALAILDMPDEELAKRVSTPPNIDHDNPYYPEIKTAWLAKLIRTTRPYFDPQDEISVSDTANCVNLDKNDTSRFLSWGCDKNGPYLAALPNFKEKTVYGQVAPELIAPANRKTAYLWLLQEAAHIWGYRNDQAKPFAESMYNYLHNHLMVIGLTQGNLSNVVLNKRLRAFYPVNSSNSASHSFNHFYIIESPDRKDPTGLKFHRCKMRSLSGTGRELLNSAAYTSYFRCIPSKKEIPSAAFSDWESSQSSIIEDLNQRVNIVDEQFGGLLESYSANISDRSVLQSKIEEMQVELKKLSEKIPERVDLLGYLLSGNFFDQRLVSGIKGLTIFSFLISFSLKTLHSISEGDVWIERGRRFKNNLKESAKAVFKKTNPNFVQKPIRNGAILASGFILLGSLIRYHRKLEIRDQILKKMNEKESEVAKLVKRLENLSSVIRDYGDTLGVKTRQTVGVGAHTQTQQVIAQMISNAVEFVNYSAETSSAAVRILPVAENAWPKFDNFFESHFAQ